MPRFAANLSMMFNEHPFLERFGAAASAGFDAVEYLFPYDFEAREISGQLQRHGLAQALFNMPPGDWSKGERGLAALPSRKDEFRKAVKMSVDYAGIIGTPLLHMMAGNAPSGDLAARQAYRENLAFAADATARAGVGLVVEPINRRDMPDYFLNDFNMAIDIINDLGHSNVKLQFDIYHRQILHGDVVKALESLMPMVGHIQIASVPLRHEPGTGELNDVFIFNALDRLGYTGFVGCEYRPAGETVAGLSWMKNC